MLRSLYQSLVNQSGLSVQRWGLLASNMAQKNMDTDKFLVWVSRTIIKWHCCKLMNVETFLSTGKWALSLDSSDSCCIWKIDVIENYKYVELTQNKYTSKSECKKQQQLQQATTKYSGAQQNIEIRPAARADCLRSKCQSPSWWPESVNSTTYDYDVTSGSDAAHTLSHLTKNRSNHLHSVNFFFTSAWSSRLSSKAGLLIIVNKVRPITKFWGKWAGELPKHPRMPATLTMTWLEINNTNQQNVSTVYHEREWDYFIRFGFCSSP